MGDRPGSQKADVWAFGNVLWELMAWQIPFADRNMFQVRVWVGWWRLGVQGSLQTWSCARRPPNPLLAPSPCPCRHARPPTPVRPPAPPQIINLVQQRGGDSLVVPEQGQLLAGPLGCYDQVGWGSGAREGARIFTLCACSSIRAPSTCGVLPLPLPAQYVALMRSCWAWEPEARPNFAAIAKQLRWERVRSGRAGGVAASPHPAFRRPRRSHPIPHPSLHTPTGHCC